MQGRAHVHQIGIFISSLLACARFWSWEEEEEASHLPLKRPLSVLAFPQAKEHKFGHKWGRRTDVYAYYKTYTRARFRISPVVVPARMHGEVEGKVAENSVISEKKGTARSKMRRSPPPLAKKKGTLDHNSGRTSPWGGFVSRNVRP